MIYTIPQLLDDIGCQKLVEYFDNNQDKLRTSDRLAQQKFYGKDIDPCTIEDDELKQALEVVKSRLICMISKYYHTNDVYLDYWDLVKWESGDWMEFHADAVDENNKPFDYCGWRTYSAILYLNDDFEGGETVFRDMNQNYIAETGKALIFPATFDYTHGVNEVSNGDRYTIAFWFTGDPKQCIKGWETT